MTDGIEVASDRDAGRVVAFLVKQTDALPVYAIAAGIGISTDRVRAACNALARNGEIKRTRKFVRGRHFLYSATETSRVRAVRVNESAPSQRTETRPMSSDRKRKPK